MSSPGMVVGSVAVDTHGNATGSDFALAIYTALAATLTVPAPPTLGQTTPPYSPTIPATAADLDVYVQALIRMKVEAARQANALAYAIVTYMQANAFAIIQGTGHGGLGGLQTSQSAGSPTTAPTTDQYVPIV